MAQAMKVSGASIRWKDMVFIRFQVEPNTMGLSKMTKGMGLDCGTRMDRQRKKSIVKGRMFEI